MSDFIFIVVTAAFFIVALVYVHGCELLREAVAAMLENILLLLLTAGLLVYLVVALLRPEKF